MLKNNAPQTHVIDDLNGEKTVETFYGKELQKTIQKEFRIEKVIKIKGGKLYVKWEGYNNSFNSWIKKDTQILQLRVKVQIPMVLCSMFIQITNSKRFAGDLQFKLSCVPGICDPNESPGRHNCSKKDVI